MKILYDYQAFTIQKYGGVSKCFCELISQLPSNIKWEIGIKESDNIHLHQSQLITSLKNSKINRETFLTKKHFRGKFRLYNYINSLFPNFPSVENINRKYSITLLKRGEYDIFHPTFFDDYYLPYLNKKPFVLTIHDMMPELFPEYFKRNDMQIVMKKKLIQKASAIVAVSEQTKSDIVHLLNTDPEKITVIYHGGPNIDNSPAKEKPIIEDPYILYVGTRDAYKNFTQFLKAFALFHKEVPDVKLICTGSPFTKAEQSLIENLEISHSIINFFANDKQLANLYAHALTFVYPSLYEGFGMPILEAYAYGCPVILSQCSCFPEIAKEAALYYNVQKGEKDLMNRLLEIYNYSDIQRQNLIQLGYERLSNYSWKNSSAQLAQLYNNII